VTLIPATPTNSRSVDDRAGFASRGLAKAIAPRPKQLVQATDDVRACLSGRSATAVSLRAVRCENVK
jgi:hypothetical protein